MVDDAKALSIQFLNLAVEKYYDKLNKQTQIRFAGRMTEGEANNAIKTIVLGPQGLGKSFIVKRLCSDKDEDLIVIGAGPKAKTLRFIIVHGINDGTMIVDTVGVGSLEHEVSTKKVIDTILKTNKVGLEFNWIVLVICPDREVFSSLKHLRDLEKIIDNLKLHEKINNVLLILNYKSDRSEEERKIPVNTIWAQLKLESRKLCMFESSDYLYGLRHLPSEQVHIVDRDTDFNQLSDKISVRNDPIDFYDADC